MTHLLAAKQLARSFYAHGSHIMLVRGPKPVDTEVSLIEREPGVVSLVISPPAALPPATAAPDTYYLVKPLFAKAPMRSAITLSHCAGREQVPVEPLTCRAVRCHGATGCSPAFDLDEAFQDALRQLPFFEQVPPSERLPLIDVVAIGALYGGFSGFSHLFLRVQAAPALPVPAEGM